MCIKKFQNYTKQRLVIGDCYLYSEDFGDALSVFRVFSPSECYFQQFELYSHDLE